METGPRLKVSSDRLVKPRIEPAALVYEASGLSTTPQQLLIAWSHSLTLCMLGKLEIFCFLLILSKLKKKSGIPSVSTDSLDPDKVRCFIRSDVGPDCLHTQWSSKARWLIFPNSVNVTSKDSGQTTNMGMPSLLLMCWLNVYSHTQYSKTCVKRPLSKRQKNWFSRPIIAYCRKKVFLQYYWPSLIYQCH